ncbi:MAG TPA: tetratricopeptide repeat protein [Kofleriaceae bacterium]|nr:tetratricopeptide repeat protein [Kofleriaceae bacterium]
MGHSRWLHAIAVVAIAVGAAAGQPAPTRTTAGSAAGSGSGNGSGSAAATTAAPAGSSPVESSDIPEWKPSPARFAVTPFINHSNARALDWLMIGAPFEIAEKTQEVLGLEPTGAPLFVGPQVIDPEPDPVLEVAARERASWVITGWVDRPNWNLRIQATLWKVDGKTAYVVAEAQKTGDPKTYHALLGDVIGRMWQKGAGITIDVARAGRLARPLATDVYAVNLMSRGLGQMIGVYGPINLKAAEHDLERAVFIDPKCYEAQRVLGELYLVLAATDPKLGGDPRYASKAAGKFAYANDLAPDDIESVRAAATSAGQQSKFDVARDLWRKLVTRKPWDLDARYQLGAALWHTGDANLAEKQLTQVTSKQPDHLPARRVLALIHASRGDTSKLVGELEAIAVRAPADLDVKADLATAYGSIGKWDRASGQLEQIAAVRPHDLALLVRIGDAKRKQSDVAGALAWYGRAQRLAPDTSMPGFLAAQTLYDANRMAEAIRAYTGLQRFREDLPAAEQALGTIALAQHRYDDAAWYLRRAAKGAPRSIVYWRSLIAAELGRKDAASALKQVERALPTWPNDGTLLYLAGVAYALDGDKDEARGRLEKALQVAPTLGPARAALDAINAGVAPVVQYTPELVRPWGDAEALVAALDRFAAAQDAMAVSRAKYQDAFLQLLGAVGKGPMAPTKKAAVRTCPLDRIPPVWAAAQVELRRYERLGGDLEAAYRFIARHDELGATAALLPNARAKVAAAKQAFRTAVADVGELRGEWVRGLGPELRLAGCTDKLLAAAVADPERYRIIKEDKPDTIPDTKPPRPKPRATFYIDNTGCPESVDVWIDGARLGEVAPGRRSALVADGGERTLCLVVPGAAQCGDRGTVRQVYLHDGWTATMHCPK